MPSFNTAPKDILAARLQDEQELRIILSFYQYTYIRSTQALRERLYQKLSSMNVLGRIYIASEGINAQISVPESQYEKFKYTIRSFPRLKDVYLNPSVFSQRYAFLKLVIKCRKSIVSDGLNTKEVDMTKRGQYLSPFEFNKKMESGNTVVIDLRNHYETEIGHFEGALLPNTDSFRETIRILTDLLTTDKGKNILLYCTGGIRCEKASSFLLKKGFPHVFQIKGGIISYFREVMNTGLKSKFRGKNFVFDDRLGEKISDETISYCYQCHAPSDQHTNCNNKECHILFIQCPECKSRFEGCCSAACKEINKLPEWVQKALRKGKSNFTRAMHSYGIYERKTVSGVSICDVKN